MTFHERSLDDLPLAAYSTGAAPAEEEPLEAALTAARRPTQQDLAAALVSASAAGGALVAVTARPRFRLPFGLPRLRRSKAAALQQAAPFQPVSQALERPGTFQPVHLPADVPPPSVARPAAPARSQRDLLRDPRTLAVGAIVVGLALLGISLLGGGPASGSGAPGGSQDTTAVQPTAAPGSATVELTSAATGIYTLTGVTGAGQPVDSQLDATWTDALGESLGITGLASQGTRTTDANFVLTWTMLVKNQPVTFTSRGSECTVGMAVGPKAVKGTFVCKDLRSGDGKHVVDLRGTYTT
jgi:hypothetical protein